MFVFPSAYGGAVQSSNPPQIHELMKKLRMEVGAVAAKKQAGGPMFPVRGAKELNQKLADALNALNMAAPVVKQEINLLPTNEIPDNKTPSGKPVFRTLAHVKSTVRLIAPDTSFIDCVGSGHGGDVDDKSGGKASTYAWKDAILKGLSIPHEDMVDTDDDSSVGGGQTTDGGTAASEAAAKGGTRKREAKKGAAAGEGGTSEPSGGSKGAVGDSGVGVSVEANIPGGLGQTLARITNAKSLADLEQLRTEIKSGALALHGADKLKATQAWVARKEAIKGELGDA